MKELNKLVNQSVECPDCKEVVKRTELIDHLNEHYSAEIKANELEAEIKEDEKNGT